MTPMPTPDEWLDAIRRGDVVYTSLGRNQDLYQWGDADLLYVDYANRRFIPIQVVPDEEFYGDGSSAAEQPALPRQDAGSNPVHPTDAPDAVV